MLSFTLSNKFYFHRKPSDTCKRFSSVHTFNYDIEKNPVILMPAHAIPQSKLGTNQQKPTWNKLMKGLIVVYRIKTLNTIHFITCNMFEKEKNWGPSFSKKTLITSTKLSTFSFLLHQTTIYNTTTLRYFERCSCILDF